jgi:arylsulfatase A-like enzyme
MNRAIERRTAFAQAVAGMVCGLGLLHLACSPETGATYLKPFHRFVAPDPGAPSPITAELPSATIQDETRPVLAAPQQRVLVPPRALRPQERGGALRLVPSVPREFRNESRLLVMPALKIAGVHTPLPPQVVKTRRNARRVFVRLDLEIPPVEPDARADLFVVAYAPDRADLGDLRMPALVFPERAELEFAIGLLEAEWGDDPVEFRVEACRAESCEPLFSERLDPSDPEGEGWRDRRVSLAGLSGSTRELRFTAQRSTSRAPFSFPVWGHPTVYERRPIAEGGENLILLSIDTLRADHLTTHGYEHDTAPFIEERFAAKGTVFDNAVAAATTTAPSHASIFTSLPPAAHRVNGFYPIPKSIPTLPEWIRNAGIDTGAITENAWIGVAHGFERGFDVLKENKSARVGFAAGHIEATFERAEEWLEWNRDKRFFLFLHTYQVHSPYAPPERYATAFQTQGVGSAEEAGANHLRLRADYDREIRYTDDELRRLFGALARLKLGHRTVVVLTSDHGEAFLEHGLLEHGGPLFEEVVRVPLMFEGPGIAAGRRIETPVGGVDLMPTILDLLGVPVPDGLAGTSLAPLLSDSTEAATLPVKPVYAETLARNTVGPDHRFRKFLAPAFMVRKGPWKLSRYLEPDGSFRYELYDLSSDPGELENLHGTAAGPSAELEELLRTYEARSQQMRERLERDSARTPADPEALVLDPEREEKLRALGYLE